MLLAACALGIPLDAPRSLLASGRAVSLYELYEDRAVHGPEQHYVSHKHAAPTTLVQLKTKVTYDPESYPGTACEVRSPTLAQATAPSTLH